MARLHAIHSLIRLTTLTTLVGAVVLAGAQPAGQREAITQGQVMTVGENYVREVRNPFAPRYFTVHTNVGFSVYFEEDTLSGSHWVLDTSQSDGAVQIQPTTGPGGLLPTFDQNNAENVRFSGRLAAQNVPLVSLNVQSFSGSNVQERRRDVYAFQSLNRASTGLAYEPTGTFNPSVIGPYGKDGNPILEAGGNAVRRRFDFKTVRPSAGCRLLWRQVGPEGAPPATGGMPTQVTFDVEVKG